MNKSVKEALSILGFDDLTSLPKLKDIRKRFLELSLKYHPDKNSDSKQSKEHFQRILDAYNVAGEAFENKVYDDDDDEDVLARKMFKQFCFSSVKENANSFTIKTEKSLYSIWKDVLSASLGQPQDLKAHGLKFTFDDPCNNPPARTFLTFYTTGKLLIQAKGNEHCFNEHFVHEHLEPLFAQVYNRKRLQKTLSYKTPITKHTGGRAVSKVHKCLKCDFKCTEISIFYQHKKREHGKSGRNIIEKSQEIDETSPTYSVLPINGSSSRSVVVVPPVKDSIEPMLSTPIKNVPCILCEESFPDPPSATKHIQTKHELKCNQCEEIFFKTDDLKYHTHKHEAPDGKTQKSSTYNFQSFEFYCMLCGSGYHTESSLNLHICTQHEVDCELCDATFFDGYDLNVHTENVHGRGFEECENRVMNMILEECINFPHTLTTQSCHPINVPEQLPESTKSTLERESPTTPTTDHESNANVYAEHECDDNFSTSYNIEQHQESTHTVPYEQTNSVLTFPCSTCGLTFLDINELSNHVQRHHAFPNLEPQSNRTADSMNFMNYIIEKNQEIIEHIRDFKDEVLQRLDKLTNEQYNFIKEFEVLGNKVNTLTSQLNDFNTPNIIRTVEKPVKDVEAPEPDVDIWVLKQNCQFCNDSFDDLKYLKKHIQDAHTTKCDRCDFIIRNEDHRMKHMIVRHAAPGKPHQESLSRILVSKCDKCDFTITSEEQRIKHIEIRHPKPDGVLWVADSILSNVDTNFLSRKMQMKIKCVKAYTAIPNQLARFPSLNFLDVLDKELVLDSYKVLVIGGGSVDISNINTKNNPDENIEEMREKAIESAKQLFCLAESALENFPSLQKVILMKRTPRYDREEDDPLGLKPQLSSLADSVTFGCWCESKYRSKIVIGGHNIPHGDSQHNSVFGVPGDGCYDGIHMNGPSGKAFLTESILSVLVKANLAEQFKPAVFVNRNSYRERTMRTRAVSHKQVYQYDAMGLMINRIRSSSNIQNLPRNQTNTIDDDVFFQQAGKHFVQRPSIIKGPVQTQNPYSIPVSNRFDILGENVETSPN